MSRTLQFKRYANTTVASTTGANGELIIDLTNQTITVHNGSKIGGTRLATESYVANSLNSFSLTVNSEIILTQAAFNKSNTASNTAISAFTKANSANILAQSAYGRANDSPNIFVGTNSFATASLGSLYFSSNTGVDIVGTTGSILYINSPQNLRTNGTPTFANVTSNNFYTNTGIDLFTFANAAYSQANVASGAAAYNQANTANLIANTAAANITVLFAIDGVQNTNIASAWSQANAANVLAQSAYTQANSANILAQAAFTAANNAAQTVPQNAQTATYTLQLSDAGKYIYYTQASNTLLYIPTTANVAFSNGTTIMIVSKTTSSANVTVSPNTGVSLYLAGNTTSASRNVTTYGMATLILADKNANTWFINGTGVS